MRKLIGLGFMVAVASAFSVLSGCASAEKIRKLENGMTVAQVGDQVGNPETIRREGERVVWFYRTDDGRCAVVFEAEHVSSWACAGDEPGDHPERALRPGTQTASAELAATAASTPPPVFIH